MPWMEHTVSDQRQEFVALARMPGSNVTALCRRFGISRTTGYKWLARTESASGSDVFSDRSRRPHHSPSRTPEAIERKILDVRAASNNVWSGRKIERVLKDAGHRGIPVPSTIVEVLRRHGKLSGQSTIPRSLTRFEHEAPNDLWQMDFKGHFALKTGRCHPLTVLDDHSRYSIGVEACANEQEQTVRSCLIPMFRRYGLPWMMLMDNGSPWRGPGRHPYSQFATWLMRLGVRVIHGRPYHPQTQGKDERFHRTLKAEVLTNNSFRDLEEVQHKFDRWRHRYNHDRPHEALDLQTPITRYRPSSRSYPEQLPPIEYAPHDIVRKVDVDGRFSYRNKAWDIGQPFRRQPIALRPTQEDGMMAIYFCTHPIGFLNLRDQTCGLVDISKTMSTTPQEPATKTNSK